MSIDIRLLETRSRKATANALSMACRTGAESEALLGKLHEIFGLNGLLTLMLIADT